MKTFEKNRKTKIDITVLAVFALSRLLRYSGTPIKEFIFWLGLTL